MISPPCLEFADGVGGLLLRTASRAPGSIFLEDRFGRVLTYGSTEVEVRKLAAGLRERGFAKGDRLAICVQNRVEVAVAVFAASMLGGLFVVLNPKLKTKGLQQILDQAQPSFLIVDETTADTVGMLDRFDGLIVGLGAVPAALPWEELVASAPWPGNGSGEGSDPACLVFTSGSTGTPRGVTLSHDNIRFVVAAIQRRLGYLESDVIGGYLPLAFDYGLYQVFLAAQVRAKLLVGDPAQVGPRLPRILREASVSVLPGVPSVYAALIALGRRGPLDLPMLRAITNTGERLPLAYIEELRALIPGLEVFVMYGLTECKRVSILLPTEFPSHSDTVGRALDGTEVYAVDGEGHRLAPGDSGELVVRGPHVALGYWRAPEETARRFRRREVSGEVELFTGDSGSVDAMGFIRFAARSDDWIKHRGHRISPLEIEMEACEIDGIVEAAVLQRESDDSLHLFVTAPESGWDEAAVVRCLAGSLESAKVPDRIHRIDEMPKSLNGKIDRKALALRLEA